MISSDGIRIDLAVFDIDGTLCSRGITVPSAVEALRHVAAMGVPVALATGRNHRELPEEFVSAADIRFCVGINGAMVSDLKNGEILTDHRIPRDTSMKLMEIARRYRSGYCVYDGGRDLIDPESLKNWEHWRRINGGYAWIPEETVEDLAAYVAGSDGVSKICAFVQGDETFLPMRAEAEALPGVSVTSSSRYEIEAMPRGISKGTALLELCAAEGIDPANVFCMGDAENDAEMLAVSGVSVAMGNACEASKTAARYLTDDVNEDGVYNAVMRFFR